MIKTRDLSKPGRAVLKGGSKIPNKDKKGWIPDDKRIKDGIAVLSELGEAGFDLAKFDDRSLQEFFFMLALFDKHVHWTVIKVARENSRRSRLKNKARKPK